MFKAVRDYSGRAWTVFRRHRVQRTARLFLFEFVVVLLGVLAAQMLQSWASNRQSKGEAASAVAHLDSEASQMLAIGNFWRDAGPCLADHVSNIARAAAAGQTMTAHEIGRPALPIPEVTQWDQATLLAVRRSFGAGIGQAYQDLVAEAQARSAFGQDIAHEWATFGLLDSAFGNPSPADRANVRLAAMRVRTAIRIQQLKASEMARTVSRLGVSQPASVSTIISGNAVDRCGLLKNW